MGLMSLDLNLGWFGSVGLGQLVGFSGLGWVTKENFIVGRVGIEL